METDSHDEHGHGHGHDEHGHDGEACNHDHGHTAAKEEHAHIHGGEPCHGHDHEDRGHGHVHPPGLAALEGVPGTDVSKAQDGGLFKQVLREGDADSGSPPVGAKVKVHYVGTLADGSKFDSSRDRPGFFEFDVGVGSVIKGWDEGICTMKKGELAVLTCRSDYAYGARGSPPKIPGGAVLTFEVELFSWKEKRKEKWQLDEAGRQAEATDLKARGTEAWTQGKVPDALDYYCDAAEYVEGEEAEAAVALRVSCLLNAAMCALKLGQHAMTESYCSKVLDIDPRSVKALFRRGSARMASGEFANAKADLREAASIDPKDRGIREALAECQKREAEAKKAEKAVYGKMFA